MERNMLFTYRAYRRLLDIIAESGYSVYGVEQILIARRDGTLPEGKYVAIRHDVDYFPGRALNMATIEAERKIATTYYIRRRFFDADPHLARKIAALGHQIGYHYEEVDVHQKAPNLQIARDAVGFFIGSLLDIDKLGFPIKTVCAHGNPLTDVDNRQVVHMLRDETYLERLAFTYDRDDQGWHIHGIAIERTVAMTNWEQYESLARFQRILEAMGITMALREAGVEEGDTVFIGSKELRWGWPEDWIDG